MRIRPTKEQFNKQLEQMVQSLRSDIIDGQLQPGDWLPPEKELVKRFGMSNNSIRVGLEQLVQEGWIEKIARVGNRVAAGRPPVKLKLITTQLTYRNIKLGTLLDMFQRKYPWITVEAKVSRSNDDFYDAQTDTIPGDMILQDSSQYWQLEDRGFTKQLKELDVKPELFPSASELFRQDGRQLMQPIIFSPVVLCYNRAHFQECGLLEPDGSWTWNDLIRHAELLSDGRNRYGFCFHVPTENRWPVFLLQSLERFEWDEGKLRDLRGSRLLESMKICKSIIHNRKAFPLYLSESNDDIDRMFMEGKVSMTLNSYIGLNGWSESTVEYDISPVPFIKELRTLVIALGAGISATSANPEEAQLLLDFLTSSVAQQHIKSHTMSIPSLGTLPPSIEPPSVYRPSRYTMYREVMASLRTVADLNIPYRLMRPLTNQLKVYWADLIDEEELCDRLIEVMSEAHALP
ncbi:MAG: hypothetical protein K0Q59_4164 [Paenibacillus sp.]|jgi:multiple sugar transport system substrate-binding protein|nr:hypothetical protein [Paenibacillus sp.]